MISERGEYRSLKIDPERLSVRERGEQSRGEGGDPEVRRGPSVGTKLWGSGEGPGSGGIEHVEQVDEEETTVGEELSVSREHCCVEQSC